MLVKCMFSGSGGQGSALMAKLVCEGAMRENLKVVMTQTYGIEQRGGDSTAFIIISDEAIGSPIVENDATIAVALSQSIYEQCLHGVAPGGMLFTNASLVENPGTAEGFTQIDPLLHAQRRGYRHGPRPRRTHQYAHAGRLLQAGRHHTPR